MESFVEKERVDPRALKLWLILVVLADLVLFGTVSVAPKLLAAVVALGGYLFLIARPWRALAMGIAGIPLLYPTLEQRELFLPVLELIIGVPLLWIVWNWIWKQPAAQGASRRYARLWSDPIVVGILLIAVLLQVGVWFTPSPLYGHSKATLFLIQSLPLFFGAVFFLREPTVPSGRASASRIEDRRAMALLWMMFFFWLVLALLALWNSWSHYYPYEGRLRILGLNTIWLGRHMAGGILVAVALLESRRLPLLLGLGVIALMGQILVLTGSRGPMAALVLSLFLWWGLRPGRRARLRFWGLAIAALAVVVVGLWFLETGAFLEATPFAGHDVSNFARTQMYEAAIGFISNAGLIGHGTGSFSSLLGFGDIRLYPHNIFAEFLLENGFVGFAIFSSWVVAVLHRGWGGIRPGLGKDREVISRLALAMFIFAMSSAQLSGDIPTNQWIWTWSGVIVAWSCRRGPAEDPFEGRADPD